MQLLIDESTFNRFYQPTVISIDHDALALVLNVPMRDEFERFSGQGQWHGGAIAAIIDIAGDFALAITLGGAVPTINYRTDYLRPAFHTSLTASAKVRRAGRTVGVVDIDVLDDSERLVAVGRGCYSTKLG